MNNENKELNDNLERLFASIKNSYDISGMIRDIKEKEEVDKPEYEILSYKGTFKIINIKEYPNSDTSLPIHSVKRLSDNEVFSLGDVVTYLPVKEFSWTIDNFWIKDDNTLLVRSKNNQHVEALDYNLGKVKDRVPLFTNEQKEEIISIINEQLGK